MEFVIVSVGSLVALIVTAAVMDLRARRTRRRLSVDSTAVVDGRRLNDARRHQYGAGANDRNTPFGPLSGF